MTKPLGIYLHIPFCEKRCAYCNFYSAVFTEGMAKKYADALKKEIKKWGGRLDRPIDTLYIGGGTPSVLGDKIVGVIDAVKQNFTLSVDAEITVEVNPHSASYDFLYAAKSVGANRLSIGVQSGNDEMLKTLGRTHTRRDAVSTVETARKIGFKNISVDLMIALPNSNEAMLKDDIDFICSLKAQHISAYILKPEPKTKIYESGIKLPDDEQASCQYLLMCEQLESKGYQQYEISNFAVGDMQSRHNLKYWNCEEYIGIGPSAHSFLNGERFYYPPDLKGFLVAPETVFDGVGGEKEERLMLALRLIKGANLSEYFENISASTQAFLKRLEKEKMIIKNGNRIALTPLGMTVSNSIITELIYENL